MPTVKPRIAVTLEQSTFEVIARMASLQGVSRGSIVAELLDSVAPALARTVALMEAAAAAPQQVRDGLRDVVESTHQSLVEVSGDATNQLDMLFDSFTRAGLDPHVVTRGSGMGVEPQQPAAKKPTKRSKPGGTAHE